MTNSHKVLNNYDTILRKLGGEYKRNNTIYIVTPFLDCNLKYESTNKMYTWPKDI